MKILNLSLIFAFFVSVPSFATPMDIRDLYVKSYGSPENPALIYVHGGPGHDSQDFEASTAQAVADEGYYVIVYDQRGQGRSRVVDDPQAYTYQRYSDDIYAIIQHYQLVKPTLLGHSHGGPISLKFDQMYPGVAGKIVLISAPVNFWKSIESIRANCSERYRRNGNWTDLAKLEGAFAILNDRNASFESQIGALATAFGLGLAKECDLYSTSLRTSEAENLRSIINRSRVQIPQENSFYPMANFLIFEQYFRLDHSEWVSKNAGRIYGIYGDEDGLFTPEVLADIQSILTGGKSSSNFILIKNASHSLFVDQQRQFISALNKALRD